MKVYLLISVVIVIFVFIIFIFLFNQGYFTELKTVAILPQNATNSNYTISGNNYISRAINFSFTNFFTPWDGNDLFITKSYASLIFIPVSSNQTNPLSSYSSTYLEFFANYSNLTVNQTMDLFISNMRSIHSNFTYTLHNLKIGGFNGLMLGIVNNSVLNTTYYTLTVVNDRLFSFLLVSGNYSIFRLANKSFSTMLGTVAINPNAS